MKPTSISNDAISKILSELKTARDKTFFILAIRTGLRVSELLSLRVKDVAQHGRIKDFVSVKRCNVKGKKASRTIVLHAEAKAALESYVSGLHSDVKLFPITRQHCWRVFKEAAERAEVAGNISPNSTRKCFARNLYLALNKDIVALSRALGHSNTASVGHYLDHDQEAVDAAILRAA